MLAARAAGSKRRHRFLNDQYHQCGLSRLEQSPPSHDSNVTAIVIAGGSGTRMNSLDKSLLLWRGRPFIAHIVARLGPQVSHIAINSNTPSVTLQSLGLPLLADPFIDRRGPLAGILAGLNYSKTALTLFVPCDNPMIPDNLLQRLISALNSNNADIAYATCTDDQHYLYALIRSHLRDNLARHLSHGDFAVRRWFAGEKAIAVDFDDRAECFLNINTPADLARLPQ
jgi:molybdenum cofactor guanylyltransferase